MEQILLGAITSQMKHVIRKSQHRFTEGKSCMTDLITSYNTVNCLVDAGQAVDIASLDFSKAFDTLPHSLLLEKVMCYGLDKWSTQQGSVLGPSLFGIFISNLDDGIKCTLMKFADDTKWSVEVDTSQGKTTLQADLDWLEEWANKNLIKFNKDKCKVLHLGKHNPGVQHRLGSTWPGGSSVERDLGVLLDNKLSMSKQCALRQRKPTGCWVASTRASPAEMKKSLSQSAQHLSSYTWNSVFSFGPCFTKKL
ncbi:rna-directed dna polymerase from mobile element jockey-like [Limosa lapponica baueri]|uniref:Rna-directed dna polymerase from mobile element jockey-like n=1 Tax=Limosa lapponica baueri TaxID=1758121 RepID=A0A2I0T7F3_LIMLA|nr:rna-directed dna polymerase from mobile element jockey-like [Limosa lapponica baueri]